MNDSETRVSLRDLSFVVFAYGRGEKTLRLVRHLERFACDYHILIFDNGPDSIHEHLLEDRVHVSHFEYERGGFINQHFRAAQFVQSRYVMLVDDDSLPAVHAISKALSELKRAPTFSAIHGSTGFFHGNDIVSVPWISQQMREDVSRFESDAAERLSRLYINFYSRYWNAIRCTNDFRRVIRAVAEARSAFNCPDVPEIVLETFTVLQGKTQDIGCVTLWKDSELPTVVTTLNPTAPSPYDFWRTRRFKMARKSFYSWFASTFDCPEQIVKELESGLRTYSLSFSNSIFTTDLRAIIRRIPREIARIFHSSVLRNQLERRNRRAELELLDLLKSPDFLDLASLSVTLRGINRPPELAELLKQ